MEDDYRDSNEQIATCASCGAALSRANSHETLSLLRCRFCRSWHRLGQNNRIVGHAVRKTTERHF